MTDSSLGMSEEPALNAFMDEPFMPVKIEDEERDPQDPVVNEFLVLDPFRPSEGNIHVLDHYTRSAFEVLSREVRQDDEFPFDQSPLAAIPIQRCSIPSLQIL